MNTLDFERGEYIDCPNCEVSNYEDNRICLTVCTYEPHKGRITASCYGTGEDDDSTCHKFFNYSVEEATAIIQDYQKRCEEHKERVAEWEKARAKCECGIPCPGCSRICTEATKEARDKFNKEFPFPKRNKPVTKTPDED